LVCLVGATARARYLSVCNVACIQRNTYTCKFCGLSARIDKHAAGPFRGILSFGDSNCLKCVPNDRPGQSTSVNNNSVGLGCNSRLSFFSIHIVYCAVPPVPCCPDLPKQECGLGCWLLADSFGHCLLPRRLFAMPAGL
jgi:hypothetical protein